MAMVLLLYMLELLKLDPVPARAHDMTPLGVLELTIKKTAPSLARQLSSQKGV